MNRKWEIEFLTRDIRKIDNGSKTHKEVAKDLYDTGYRKADTVRKETAKEILTIVGNVVDDDGWTKLKDYQWFTNLCAKYGVKIKQ